MVWRALEKAGGDDSVRKKIFSRKNVDRIVLFKTYCMRFPFIEVVFSGKHQTS